MTQLRLATIFISIVIYSRSWADYAITAQEVLMLPPTCLSLSDQNFEPDALRLAKTQRRAPLMGPHQQHFCHGKKAVIRATRSMNAKERRRLLRTAAGEFEYVLSRIASNEYKDRYGAYIAITSIEKAKVLEKLDDQPGAEVLYRQAIRFSPQLPNSYSALSDLYVQSGRIAEARSILERGLKNCRRTKGINRRLRELPAQQSRQ